VDHPTDISACPWVATEIFVFKLHVLVYSETPFKADNSHKIHCMLTLLDVKVFTEKNTTHPADEQMIVFPCRGLQNYHNVVVVTINSSVISKSNISYYRQPAM